MSVLMKRRKKSKFEVYDHWYNLRAELTDLLLRDFGYSFEKSEQKLNKRFGNKSFDSMNENEKKHYTKTKERYEAFDEWWFYAWFRNHYKLMSKLQRNNMVNLFKEVSQLCIS